MWLKTMATKKMYFLNIQESHGNYLCLRLYNHSTAISMLMAAV